MFRISKTFGAGCRYTLLAPVPYCEAKLFKRKRRLPWAIPILSLKCRTQATPPCGAQFQKPRLFNIIDRGLVRSWTLQSWLGC
ncbi:hypothetical protein PILCRDRAFT_550962 [Piloderma croceum F 1598]|uniref:Uncharacterized protein n=1 Tax=Piloderma croceum (strain F 1598) TaxID=765440 RepID=A0A0C3FIM4_PILCF|nr:hypothetical protein PILCRDRAFT_550962 [Piloderma croceum F 1598]